MQAPPSGLEEAPNGRDPADIDPGPASTDPDPAQGIEEGGQFADQAQALEQEAIAQAEDQTGREFTEEDVRVTSAEQNGQTQLEAELTETGQQQIEFEQFQREFQAEQELERRIQQQTDEQLTRGDDFTIDTRTRDDGQTVFSVDFERGPRDTDVSPSLSRGSESADVPDDGDGDMFSGAVSDAEDGLSRVAQLYTRNPNADVDLPGEGSIVNQARQDAAGADSDRFGDTDLTLPFTDIEVGETTAQAGQAFDENVAQPVGQVTGDIADLAQSGATVFGASNPTLLLAGATDPGQVETEFDEGDERVADVVRGEEADKSSDRAFERFAEGAGTGAANIANLPAVANTGIRAGEFAIEAGEQTAAGRGGEFAGAAAGAGVLVGARAAKAAKENPLEVSGQIAGSTVAAGAAIGTASRLAGSGAGRATSAAIQPGEELALAAARRAGRRSGGSSSSRIGSLFERGGGDSPSTSVRTVDRRPEDPGLSVPAESDTGGRLDNLRTFFGDDRGMGDMTLTTSRTRTDTDTSLDAPAESQLPPREAFSSDEEYARALARARAKDDLPPAEEFPNREQFASELDQRARQVADDGVFGQDSKTSFDSETTTDTAVETETQFDRPGRGQQTTATAATALRLESDVQTAAFAAGQTAQEATAAFGVDTVADTIAAPSLALDTNTVTETVTDTETATETTQDLQTDLRQDLDTGLRTRTRTTTRTDLLGESRREVEPEAFLEDAGGLMGLADDSAETTTRRFEYNIASPDDVLSGGEDIGL